MALDDMYQITHSMTQFGQPQLNTFHVLRANAGESAGSISDAFQNSILPILRLFQSNTIINNEIRIFNLETTTDFGTFTLSSALGLRVGNDNASFVSTAMRFPTRDRDVRSGHKRFGGTLEEDIVDGVLQAAPLVLLTDIGDAMIANWLATADSHFVCSYVIIKRICETFDIPLDKCLEYRLPETNGELVFYQPNTFVTNPEISSQVSRKVF